MLIAEIRRKLMDLEDPDLGGESGSFSSFNEMLSSTKEDLLTADVFGALKYLPRSPYLVDLIRSVADENLEAVEFTTFASSLTAHSASKVRFDFWPSFPTPSAAPGSTVEPDVVLQSDEVLLFVEAKLTSGFGAHQIERELLTALEQAEGREPFLLLVTAGRKPRFTGARGRRRPSREHLHTIEPDNALSLPACGLLRANASRVLTTSWQKIFASLLRSLKYREARDQRKNGAARSRDMLEDLSELMAMRDLQPFRGFQELHSYCPTPIQAPLFGLTDSGPRTTSWACLNVEAIAEKLESHPGQPVFFRPKSSATPTLAEFLRSVGDCRLKDAPSSFVRIPRVESPSARGFFKQSIAGRSLDSADLGLAIKKGGANAG